MKKVILLIMVLTVLITGCQKSAVTDTNKEKDKVNKVETEGEDQEVSSVDVSNSQEIKDLSSIKGVWEGNLSTERLGTFDIILNIYVNDNVQKLLVSSVAKKFSNYPAEWEVKDNHLMLTMNDEENKLIIDLTVLDATTLSGTYTQYSQVTKLTFKKTSDKAVDLEFNTKSVSYEERLQQLKDYSDFADDGTTIPYTYKLNQRNKYTQLIKEYDLDTITTGHEDVDLMVTLLNWVCDHVKHYGMTKLPDKRDAISLISAAKSNNNSSNCRGLSIILAELLRLYGIDAKHITCMPKETNFDDCHVVVHAYSEKLGQWIMLDPTYRLILKDKKGDYVNLPMLRKMLIDNETLVANEDAGYNGEKFDMQSYREYMTKNTFRFSCATNLYYGAENSLNGNTSYMLVPLNYSEGKDDVVTTSSDAFWALPR